MCRWTAAGVVIAMAGCGGGSGGGVEEQIRRDLGRQLGVRVERLRCPPGAFPKACAADLPGTPGVEVTVADGPDGVEWSLAGFLIATAPLEVEIAAELDDLGVEATADCGPAYRVTHVGDRVPCTLEVGGARGAAWARITDDAADFDLELALDPAAVAARTGEADEADLERLSRALDRDDAEGREDDGATANRAPTTDGDAAGASAATPAAAVPAASAVPPARPGGPR